MTFGWINGNSRPVQILLGSPVQVSDHCPKTEGNDQPDGSQTHGQPRPAPTLAAGVEHFGSGSHQKAVARTRYVQNALGNHKAHVEEEICRWNERKDQQTQPDEQDPSVALSEHDAPMGPHFWYQLCVPALPMAVRVRPIGVNTRTISVDSWFRVRVTHLVPGFLITHRVRVRMWNAVLVVRGFYHRIEQLKETVQRVRQGCVEYSTGHVTRIGGRLDQWDGSHRPVKVEAQWKDE